MTFQIFFMHIGKTAGSAVNKMLRQHFGEHFIDHIEGKQKWWDELDSYACLSGHFHYPRFKKLVGDRPFKYVTVMRDPLSQFRSHLNWIKTLGANPNLRKTTSEQVLRLSDEIAKIDLKDPLAVRHFITCEPESVLRVSLFDNCQTRYFLDGPTKKKFDLADFRVAVFNMQAFDFVGVSEDTSGMVAGIRSALEIEDDLKLPYANVQSYERDFDREAFRSALGDWIGFDCALYELARVRAGC